MWNKIKQWYEGEQIAHENDPASLVVIFGFYTKRHWTASVARAVVTFYLSHWKWLWGFVVSVFALYLGYLKL